MEKLPNSLRLIAFWILFSAFLTCTGWVLSLVHQLNAAGYLVAFSLGGILCLIFRQKLTPPLVPFRWKKLRWRARHGLPAIFYLITSLAFVGGALYAPNNFDALAYRVPRVLHWIAQGQWHWIQTPNSRMNFSGAGFEWFMVPSLVFAKTDRLFFLVSIISQLLLPGLIYSCFIQLGISKKVAWFWMWLLPCGYGFALQAGSIANDTFAVPFFLAGLAFSLIARRTLRVSHLWLGMLAIGLTTGAKACNLPLLLPWLLATLPSWPLLKTRPVSSCGIALIAVAISFLPLACLNSHFSGDWTGDPKNGWQAKITNPSLGFIGNGLQLLVKNASPSVNPFSKPWNAQMDKLEQTRLFRGIRSSFPRVLLKCEELAQEEGAGLGLGIACLLLISGTIGVMGPRQLRRQQGSQLRRRQGKRLGQPGLWHDPKLFGYLIALSGYPALFVYMIKIGSEDGPRLVSAFYPITVALLLLPSVNAVLVRKKWYRSLGLLAAASTIPAVILTPSRPLWPAITLTEKLAKSHPNSAIIQRARTVYQVYGMRSDVLAPLRRYIPEGMQTVGYAGINDPEVSLWRPFGSRRVVELTEANSTELFSKTPLLFGPQGAFEQILNRPVKEWLAENHARVVARELLSTRAGSPPQEWLVVEAEH